ncbi:hypothetical protein [Pacificibacter marinus]|uniref:hypothetical protein n=1 Tax=Pacificibacter marinus TaxID=658057 RepID=UPI001BA53409|nr:hypothetical protein [Pacificibacter marinus]
MSVSGISWACGALGVLVLPVVLAVGVEVLLVVGFSGGPLAVLLRGPDFRGVVGLGVALLVVGFSSCGGCCRFFFAYLVALSGIVVYLGGLVGGNS